MILPPGRPSQPMVAPHAGRSWLHFPQRDACADRFQQEGRWYEREEQWIAVNTTSKNRLIIASNRLPVVLTKVDDGQWRIEPGAGGLINALAPVLRDRGGIWVGWPGVVEEDMGDDVN